MSLFAFNWMSFFILGFGTTLLIGELLVKAKGIFAIFGFTFISLYFYAYLDTSMFFMMAIIYFSGVLLIFIDGEFVNEGTLAVLGVIMMIISIGVSSPNWVVGLYAIIGVVIGSAGSLFWLKFLPKRQMWSKIALADRLTDDKGYSSMNVVDQQLIGQTGVALSNLRPVGTVEIDKKMYSAISNGYWIEKDSSIIVKQVDGTRILVDHLDKDKQ